MTTTHSSSSTSSTSTAIHIPPSILAPHLTHSTHTRTMEAWMQVRASLPEPLATEIQNILISSCYALIEKIEQTELWQIKENLSQCKEETVQHIVQPVLARLNDKILLQEAQHRSGLIGYEDDPDLSSNRDISGIFDEVRMSIIRMPEGLKKNFLLRMHGCCPFEWCASRIDDEDWHTSRMEGANNPLSCEERLAYVSEYLHIFRRQSRTSATGQVLVAGSDTIGLMYVLINWMLGHEVKYVLSEDCINQSVVLSGESIHILRWFGIIDYLIENELGIENRTDDTFATSSENLENALKNLLAKLQPKPFAYVHCKLVPTIENSEFVVKRNSEHPIAADTFIIADADIFNPASVNQKTVEATETYMTCAAVFDAHMESYASSSQSGKRKLKQTPSQTVQLVKRGRKGKSNTEHVDEESESLPLFSRVKVTVLPHQTFLEMSWPANSSTAKCATWAALQYAALQDSGVLSSNPATLHSTQLLHSRVKVIPFPVKYIAKSKFIAVGSAEYSQCFSSDRWHSEQITRTLTLFNSMVNMTFARVNRFKPNAPLRHSLVLRWHQSDTPPLLELFFTEIGKNTQAKAMKNLLSAVHFTHFLRINNLTHSQINYLYRLTLQKVHTVERQLRETLLARLLTRTKNAPETDPAQEDFQALLVENIELNCLENRSPNKHRTKATTQLLIDNPALYFEEQGAGALPTELLAHLQQLVLSHECPMVNLKARLLGETSANASFPRSMMLQGPAGTGKTLIAQLLASLLGVRKALVYKGHVTGELEGFDRLDLRDIGTERSLIILDNVDLYYDIHHGPGEILDICELVSEYPNIYVIGTTSNPEELGPEVTSTGRLFPIFKFAQPDLEGRKSIFRIHLRDLWKNKILADDVDIDWLAETSEGMVGSDIAALIRRVHLNWAFNKAGRIEMEDLRQALQPCDTSVALSRLMTQPHEFLEELGVGGMPPSCIQALQSILAERNRIKKKGGTFEYRGIMLSGPPGTGKTTLARQIGKVLSVPDENVTQVCGSDFLMKYVGDGEKKLRSIFSNAKRAMAANSSQMYLIIIDEINAIVADRSKVRANYSKTLVNQFLNELDGLSANKNVFVIGITNNLETVDAAALRPGRLWPTIDIPLPDAAGRKSIFKIHMQKLVEHEILHSDIDVDQLVELSKDMSGADIAGLVNEAFSAWSLKSLAYARGELSEKPMVTMADFRKLFQPLDVGLLTSRLMTHPREYLEEMGVGGVSDECIDVLKSIAISRSRFDENEDEDDTLPCRGIMLTGPAGTGKTTLARNIGKLLGVTNENLTFISGSDFVKSFVGSSEEKVREIFAQAKRSTAPGAHKNALKVIVIDEIDVIIGKRTELHHGHEKSLVNQFLFELDGLSKNKNLLVIGITNSLNNVDPAALRPGRLSPTITMPLPDAAGREAIFKIHAQKMVKRGILHADVSFARLAEETKGLSGADIAGIVHDVYSAWLSRRAAAPGEKPLIQMQHFVEVYHTPPVPVPKELFADPEKYLEDIGVVALPKNCIEYLQNIVISRSEFADEMHKSHVKVPRGIILSGPPGTGKTTLAKHLGTILGIPDSRVIYHSGAAFASKWVGESAANVRNLFAPIQRESRRSGAYGSPFMLIIDEADALLGTRDGIGTHTERRAALTTFLEYVDGLETIHNVFIIAITNTPESLDPAVTRPGRLHPTIQIDNPNEAGRSALFRVHTRKMVESGLVAPDIDFDKLAKATSGLNGSHIASIIQAASLIRLRRKVLGKGNTLLTEGDLMDAIHDQQKKATLSAPPPGLYT